MNSLKHVKGLLVYMAIQLGLLWVILIAAYHITQPWIHLIIGLGGLLLLIRYVCTYTPIINANFNMAVQYYTLFIAEDDPDDQILLKDAIQENQIEFKQTVFTNDGVELMQALRASERGPCIIILDLNMPRKDGREILSEIKNDLHLRHIPVIILTTSNSSEDITQAYQAGSNTYFTKPSNYADLVEIIRLIKTYWLEKARLAI